MAVRDPKTEWVRVRPRRCMAPAECMEIAARMCEDAVALIRSSTVYRIPGIPRDAPEYEV